MNAFGIPSQLGHFSWLAGTSDSSSGFSEPSTVYCLRAACLPGLHSFVMIAPQTRCWVRCPESLASPSWSLLPPALCLSPFGLLILSLPLFLLIVAWARDSLHPRLIRPVSSIFQIRLVRMPEFFLHFFVKSSSRYYSL